MFHIVKVKNVFIVGPFFNLIFQNYFIRDREKREVEKLKIKFTEGKQFETVKI